MSWIYIEVSPGVALGIAVLAAMLGYTLLAFIFWLIAKAIQ